MEKNDLLSNIIENSSDLKENKDLSTGCYTVLSDNQGIQFLIPDQYRKIESYHNKPLNDQQLHLLNKKFNLNLTYGKIFVEHTDADYLFGEPYYIITATL
ncbi:hypothetical protein [Enterococcus thailandicus]